MPLRFAANLSMLWAGLPLPAQFERAARAGFGAVELWWPGDADAALLPGLTRRWGMQLALLNFDAGDMAAGDRGLAADPARTAQLRQHVPAALRNVRLQYDVYHMQRVEGEITGTLNAYWDLISHIQIADVPGRGEPGTGEINYPFVLGHLERKGYRGYVGLEYRPSAGPAEDTFGWLRELGPA